MRLIDADALIKTIRENDYLVVDYFNSKDRGMFTSGMLQAIDEQPTAQPEQQECEKCIFKPFKQFQPERKKGKWIECDHDKWNGDTFAYRCSECNGAYHLNIEQVIGVWNFCPNCGADMRGENHETD